MSERTWWNEVAEYATAQGYEKIDAAPRYADCAVCGSPMSKWAGGYHRPDGSYVHAHCILTLKKRSDAAVAQIQRDIDEPTQKHYESEQDRLDVEGEPLNGGSEVWGGPAD